MRTLDNLPLLQIETVLLNSKKTFQKKLNIDFRIVYEIFDNLKDQTKYPVIEKIYNSDYYICSTDELKRLIIELKDLKYSVTLSSLNQIINELSHHNKSETVVFKSIYKESEAVEVSFEIYCGDDNPDDLTKLIGLNPSYTGYKGQLVSKKSINEEVISQQIRESYWVVASSLSKTVEVEEHIKSLLTICRPFRKSLAAAANKYGGIKVSIGVKFYTQRHQFWFDADTIKELSYYNSRIWIDIIDEEFEDTTTVSI